VTLYPTFIEALYALQESVLSAPVSRQIVAICDERSEQYSLLNSILGSYPVDRVLRVDPALEWRAATVDEVRPDLLWWESVPYPKISWEGVESSIGMFPEAPIRVVDATMSPLAIQLVDTDYCLLSDMRGIVGHANISCAALVGVSRRAGSAPFGDAVSGSSLSAVKEAIPTARQRESTRIRNAMEVEAYFGVQNFLGRIRRPNTERAAWIIEIKSGPVVGMRQLNSELFDQVLGLDTSSLVVVKDSVSSSGVADLILSVGLERPEDVIGELNRLFQGS